MDEYLSRHILQAAELGLPIVEATEAEIIDLIRNLALKLSQKGEIAGGACFYQTPDLSVLTFGGTIRIGSEFYSIDQTPNQPKNTVFCWENGETKVFQQTEWLSAFWLLSMSVLSAECLTTQ